MNLVKENREAINSLCDKHKVAKLYAFGSVLTTSFNSESDVDFLVDFKDTEIQNFATNFFALKWSLEDLFGREVDLIESEAISNPYFKEEIEETKKLVYESRN